MQGTWVPTCSEKYSAHFWREKKRNGRQESGNFKALDIKLTFLGWGVPECHPAGG